MEGEPDWLKVRAEVSDADFLKQKADWEAGKAQRDQLRRHQQEERDQAQRQAARQHAARLQAEQTKLLAAGREWKSTAKGRAGIAKLGEFVRTTYAVSDQDG